MSRDKQIEEMAKHCPYYYRGECIIDNELPEKCDRFCQFGTYAEILYNAGYRKASEVAREICKMLREDLRGFVDSDYLERLIAVYEKKFIGEDTNVHTNTEGK